jgi:hypothetical protein
VAGPIDVLVLRQLTDERGAVGTQARDNVVEVVDGEHDATNAQRVRRRIQTARRTAACPPLPEDEAREDTSERRSAKRSGA